MPASRVAFTARPEAGAARGELLALDRIRVGDRLAVDSLALGAGERLLVHGGNGAGKSTLLRVMAGELAPDTGGAGEFRGGNGLDLDIRLLEDAELTSVVDRTLTPPAGLGGGGVARPNAAFLRLAGGERLECAKATRLRAPADSVLELRTGGGGGFGDPIRRAVEAVAADVREGYVTEERARYDYPHAFIPRR